MDKKVLRKIKRNDSLAALGIRAGGVLVIASVILILLLIGKEALPLFYAPQAELSKRFALPDELVDKEIFALGVDEYREIVYVVDELGQFTFVNVENGLILKRLQAESVEDGLRVTAVERIDTRTYALSWNDGHLSMDQVAFSIDYDAHGKRVMHIALHQLGRFEAGQQIAQRLVARQSDHGATLVRQFGSSDLEIIQQVEEEDLFGNVQSSREVSVLEGVHPDPISAVTLNADGSMLYAGTSHGALLRWDLSTPGEPLLLDKLQAFRDRRAITSLALMLGQISLAVGDDGGLVTVWFPTPTEEGDGHKRLQLIHTLSRHDTPVAALVPSLRNRTLVSLGRGGVVHLDYSTSERHLLTLVDNDPVLMCDISQRGDGLVALQPNGQVALWSIDNPHPEISFSSLFSRVWYESYSKPEWVWQSSSASDDFEAKMSLTPLIYGTLKGTFYAMIFAVPLALLGAVYTSQFGSKRLRELIKPSVEIMAAVPSVIIGFLAALWFAPLLETHFPGFVLSLLIVPLVFLLLLILWQPMRDRPWAKYVESGHEFIVMAPLLVLAVAIALQLGPWFEQLLFDGNFKLWLFSEVGMRYDSRNSIVISFALGFAVIPIIFTITEDALSNVPQSLKAASLALGASRWQTVWRVVLPSASPGIFAAVMIGLGRAVGETMIVLMATGNTPIMDLSIFNGMRPLSANIAVEIPEAPHGDTLYRVLFLSAVLLFILTFILNTVAEVVRHRLRRKYGRF
ncbi:ABC transporter permease subunit [Desulfuromonas acetoxidans]|uniref:Binding-protein-dependent transport systems inner membrane component n=1 Tax=Desulfuromonas acetoxidans (strain DSM 684 / 11070) TaxID=281689 RepID=Q1K264_DESA6|nr:ABC transporter permease subunit [Desulfuromonas acetoxidans]EAT16575.1 binding-protein-dependent transport systems inner membrane component [Desulfuromonas acetoxidans DSM 684]MBF0644460.1 ABC transporter permease subunit [Desulfuromonas acetoxidans]NVD24686.1 ABC transporter permease subunit [Desulfuromonas acetoxidans]NVE16731.1 ABC transporter permease subunit [Desulfuromonas acetoxidans]